MSRPLSSLLAAIMLLAGVPAHGAKTYPIQQYELRNGLKVVLSEDRSTPAVAVALAYDVGSRNEVVGRSGFAHLFEHMMFQGSDHVGKFEHARLIESNGGIMNGFTRTEDTTYIETVPAEKLPLILWLEADRMNSLKVNADNLTNQRAVVEEEKRLRYDNQPYVNERAVLLPALAFTNFANQHSTIGSMADLEAATLLDVQQFHRTYYAPNNATLVLVGNFEPATARALIQSLFGTIPRVAAPPVPDLTEPPQTQSRSQVVSDPLARVPALAIGWHGPSLGNPDVYAVDLMNAILFNGQTSRAYQDLVKKRRLALSIQGGLNAQRGPSLSTLFAVFPQAVHPSELVHSWRKSTDS